MTGDTADDVVARPPAQVGDRRRDGGSAAHLSPDALRSFPVPPIPGGRAVIAIVAATLGTVLTLLCVLRVDILVEASGRIAAQEDAAELMSLNQAIVRRVNVVPGQVVEEGAVLVEFDLALSRIALGAAREQVASLEAEQERIGAELENRPMIAGNGAAWLREVELLANRRSERDGRRLDFEQRQGLAEAEARSAREQLRPLGERQRSADAVAQRLERNWMTGHTTVTAMDEAIQRRARVEQELLTARQRIDAADLALRAVPNDRSRWEAEWRQQAMDRRTEGERRLIDARRALDDAAYAAEHNVKRAPYRAVVLEVPRTAGSVSGGGQVVLRLTRADMPVHAVLDIEPRDAVRVTTGMPARLEFRGLPAQDHGEATGRVSGITGNVVEREVAVVDGGRPTGRVFRASVTLDPANFRALRNLPAEFRPSPGHEITARLRVGERAPIRIILDPLLAGRQAAFAAP